MYLARREVGALTRALQRCLPRRKPSLELEFDLRTSGFTELRFGRLVEVVISEAAHAHSEERVRVALEGRGWRVYPARPNHPT